MEKPKPPSKIGGLTVILFAENDDKVEYSDAINLVVNNFKIEESRYLAICKESYGAENTLLVFCDYISEIKGVIAVSSVDEGIDIAEKSYKGISENWTKIDSGNKIAEKTAFELERCTFCNKYSREVGNLYGTEKALICNECIEYFHGLVKSENN